MELEKTTQMNLLVEFYGTILTDKQLEYMELYYGDDYSLGEIAEEFDVSRQAVYDNIRRSAKLLENYEEKLHLVADFYKRQEHYDELEKEIQKNYPEATQLASIVSKLQEMKKETQGVKLWHSKDYQIVCKMR